MVEKPDPAANRLIGRASGQGFRFCHSSAQDGGSRYFAAPSALLSRALQRLAADLVLAIADENFCESRILPRAIPTKACSMQALSSGGRRQARQPFAFDLR